MWRIIHKHYIYIYSEISDLENTVGVVCGEYGKGRCQEYCRGGVFRIPQEHCFDITAGEGNGEKGRGTMWRVQEGLYVENTAWAVCG